MDSINNKILKLLREDAKQNFKGIGEKIHMTGQAVGIRVKKLEEEGIIESYTIRMNNKKRGVISAYMTVFLKEENHERFRGFVKRREEITEAYRTSGEGCYMMKVEVADMERLNALCDDASKYVRYRVNIITDQIK